MCTNINNFKKLNSKGTGLKFLIAFFLMLMSLSLVSCLSDQKLDTPPISTDDPTLTNNTDNTTPSTPTSTRPAGVSFIPASVCACSGDQQLSINDCASFCSGHSSLTNGRAPMLYGSVKLDASIEADNSPYKNFYGWCTAQLSNETGISGCQLELRDGYNTIYIPLTAANNQNTFQAQLDKVEYDKTYLVRVMQTPSNVYSDTFQLRLRDPTYVAFKPQLPIMTTPISSYLCIYHSGTIQGNILSYTSSSQYHLYYPADDPPPPITIDLQQFFLCHDVENLGLNDNISYPRLNLTPRAFTLWSKRDNHFKNTLQQGGNASDLDINKEIQNRLLQEYNITSTTSYFVSLSWFNSMQPSSSSSSSTQQTILDGYYLQPLQNTNTKEVICPTMTDYMNGTIPEFRILGDYIGGDTEALYLAESEPQYSPSTTSDSSQTQSFNADFIFVREGLIKKIWFYVDNGNNIQPQNQSQVTNKAMQFYWPPDTVAWNIKKDYQRIYTVKSTQDLSSASVNLPSNSLEAVDKRLACIPKID